MRISDWSSDVCSSDLGILDSFAADGVDVVAVAGGDGTVQAVLTALYGRRPFRRPPLLAVLPRGTTNMTAADIGLPRRGDKDTLGSLARLLAAAPAELEAAVRSEEHTSELQSLMRISYAVFCLKKKNTTTQNYSITHKQSHT